MTPDRGQVWLILWACMVFSGWASAQPKPVREFAQGSADNLVRIEARASDGSVARSGFGYIVGTSAQRLTVATARHVIAELLGIEYRRAASIEIITVHGDRYAAATVHFAKDPNGADLGFVQVIAQAPLALQTRVIASEPPTAGEEVWLFGTRREFRLNPASGRVASLSAALLRVAALGGAQGASGAPVLSSRGVIGLYLGADPARTADVLPIGVARQAAASSGLAWTLGSFPSSLDTVAVRLSRADSLEVPVSTLPRGGKPGVAIPGSHAMAPGSYGLDFDVLRVECVPRSFVIGVASATQDIEVSCSARLDGNWSSPEAHAVISALGNGDYELTSIARNNLPSNSLRGRLIQTRQATAFHTNLSDLLGRDRSGTMTVTRDLQEMTIVFPISPGELRTLVLRRQ